MARKWTVKLWAARDEDGNYFSLSENGAPFVCSNKGVLRTVLFNYHRQCTTTVDWKSLEIGTMENDLEIEDISQEEKKDG